ncbi:MAG: hypothetical protein ACRD2E_06080 [Terriglobales bacterium]
MRGIFAFACVLALCACAAAQTGLWAAVEGVPPRSPVEVRRSRAATVKGTFVEASDSGMDVLTPGGSTRHIDRTQITRVYLNRKSHMLRDAAIGAGVGGAGGAAFAAADGDCSLPGPGECSKSEFMVYAGLAGAGVVAIIAAVIGLIKGPARTLIYQRDSGHGQRAPKQRTPTAAAATAH